MDIRLHSEALAELERAGEWYESRRPGLGQAFAVEVQHALDLILESPARWPVEPNVKTNPPVQRFVLPSFPFVLPYLALQDSVVILAIAHMSRPPGYWSSRLR